MQEHRHPSFAALAPEIGGVGGDWKRISKWISEEIYIWDKVGDNGIIMRIK